MDRRFALAWLLAAGLALAAIPAPGLTGIASAGHGSPINATAIWEPTTPGADNATVTAFATAADDADLEGGFGVWENFTTVIPAAVGTSTCTPPNARAAGIDRDNDDPGTETDVSMVGRFKYWVRYANDADQTVLTIEFYDEDDFGGQHVHLNHTDQIVAKIADCFSLPEDPGWYRNYGHTNGTDWHGEYAETDAYSHWYYFCECDSYDEAVERLGPPPQTELAESDGTVGREPGPYYLAATPDGGSSDGGSGTPTATGTPSPAETSTPPPDAATSPTPAAGTSSPADTAGQPGAGEPTTVASQPTAAATVTVGPETTGSGGPGFGPLATLLALVTGGALAWHHRK